MDANMQALMDEFNKRFEANVKAQENALANAQKQFEDTLAEAREQLSKVVNSETNENVEEESPNTTPAAAWINAPDGEQMMVLNKEAVVMFLAIFKRIEDVANSFKK